MSKDENNTERQNQLPSHLAQEEEMLLLRSFTTRLRHPELKVEEDEFEKYFKKALHLHDEVRDQHNMEAMVEIEEHATNILQFKVNFIIYEYLRALGTEALKSIMSGGLDLKFALRWERPLKRSGYGILDYERKFRYSIKMLRGVQYLIKSRVEPRNLEVLDESSPSDPLLADHKKTKDEPFEPLDPLIKSLYDRLKNETKLDLQQYFRSSFDIESVKSLFALFAIIDEGKASLLSDLGVEIIEHT